MYTEERTHEDTARGQQSVRRETSEETKLANTLILEFEPPELLCLAPFAHHHVFEIQLCY